MLVGREHELAVTHRVLREALAGRGGALLVRGEPGIGKTAILLHARGHAREMTIVEAAGVEAEAELPFAGLAALLAPLLGHLPELPVPQREAVEAALALAPAGAPERFAVSAGTLGLLAAASAERPVLALVDDAHWLDRPSREALLFAARRIRNERVALLLASRDFEPSSLVGEGLEELRLGALDDVAAFALLGRAGVSDAVAPRVARVARGNPLALLEIPTLLSEDERAGRQPLEELLPTNGAIERAFLQRARRLPDATRRALVVVAAEASNDIRVVATALHNLGLDVDALVPAEHVGLVELANGSVGLRHPLIRSALYAGADPVERRAAHAALADALRSPADADRRAWHLADAALGPSEEVAVALEHAAERASTRSGYSAASAAMERAARLSTEPGREVPRLVAAARTAQLGGHTDRARALLETAAARTDDPLLLADVHHVGAQLAIAAGRAVEGADALAAHADRVRASDPARAVEMLRDAALAAVSANEWERAEELASDAAGFGEAIGASGDRLGKMVLAAVRARRAQANADAGWDAIEEAARDLRLAPAVLLVTGFLGTATERGRRVVDDLIARARERSALGVLPQALADRAGDRFYAGRWREAAADADEAASLARETGQPLALAEALTTAARIEAFQGKEGPCRAHAEEARSVALVHAPRAARFLGVILGELELGLGRPEAAIAHLEPAVADLEPAIAHARWDLIEAQLLAGRRHDAEAGVEVVAARVQAMGGRGTSMLEILRGLTAGEEEFSSHFERALELEPWPLDRARAHLVFGERLRRAKRRAKAREQLTEALVAFDRFGARPWAERARRELEATGERVRRRDAAQSDELTPTEFRVAQIVADGATNKEAARQLFVSPNTIEFHLKNVFRKLGVRSRTELARRVAA